MLSTQQALRGRVVYGNGSLAPNKGRVSAAGAQGYIQREVAKRRQAMSPVGKDGQSDRRSGIAQAAMARATPKKPPTKTPVKGTQPKKPAPKPKPKKPAAPAPVPYKPPAISVSPTGAITFPMGQYGPEMEQALADYNTQIMTLQQQDQQNALEYQDALRQANEGYSTQRRSTLNDAAARGMAYSTGYSQAVGQDASNYTNTVGKLNQANATGLQSSAQQRALLREVFNRQLANATRSAAADAAAKNASNYGSAPKPKSAKRKSRPKKKAKK